MPLSCGRHLAVAVPEIPCTHILILLRLKKAPRARPEALGWQQVRFLPRPQQQVQVRRGGGAGDQGLGPRRGSELKRDGLLLGSVALRVGPSNQRSLRFHVRSYCMLEMGQFELFCFHACRRRERERAPEKQTFTTGPQGDFLLW